MRDLNRSLFLCAGLPSSGSTLVSWCFLQRPDTDGVLDAASDVLPQLPDVRAANLWCKTTINSFRLTELIEHCMDQGYQVKPILVVRDVRAIFNSLIAKPHIANGTTAEEPPLRTRMRRFLQDWQALRDRAVVIRYESLVRQPDHMLRAACEQLDLAWSGDMLAWPKPPSRIADHSHASPAFLESRCLSFIATVDPALAEVRANRVPQDDLDWLESEFAEFNQVNGYVEHLPRAATRNSPRGRAEPTFTSTRRHRKLVGLQNMVGSKLHSIAQVVRNPLRGLGTSAAANKSHQNYMGYATLFAD